MEIKIDSEWQEKHEMGEVVTVTGRYFDLDNNKIMIGYSWFGELSLHEVEDFKKEFCPIRESIPDKSDVLHEAVVLLPYIQYKDLLSKVSILPA